MTNYDIPDDFPVGDEWAIRFTVTDETGAAYDFTGKQLRFTVSKAARPVAEASTADGTVIVTGVGQVDVAVPAIDTDVVEPDTDLLYELKMASPVRTVARGRFRAVPSAIGDQV